MMSQVATSPKAIHISRFVKKTLACHSCWKLDNWICQFLIFRPRFPHDDIDAKHNKKQRKKKGKPIYYRHQPAQQMLLCVQRRITLVVA